MHRAGPTGSPPGSATIWPRPAIWLWLVANILWLQLVVPVWIVSADLVVMDPDATFVRRAAAAGVMIVVIPFLGVIGIALLTLVALLAAERMVRQRPEP
jgi:hypothetical protein